METKWVSIDGDEYTEGEAIALMELGMVERCPHSECPHNFHKLDEYSEADLLVALERIGYVD